MYSLSMKMYKLVYRRIHKKLVRICREHLLTLVLVIHNLLSEYQSVFSFWRIIEILNDAESVCCKSSPPTAKKLKKWRWTRWLSPHHECLCLVRLLTTTIMSPFWSQILRKANVGRSRKFVENMTLPKVSFALSSVALGFKLKEIMLPATPTSNLPLEGSWFTCLGWWTPAANL